MEDSSCNGFMAIREIIAVQLGLAIILDLYFFKSFELISGMIKEFSLFSLNAELLSIT